jgi:hypothetical protein
MIVVPFSSSGRHLIPSTNASAAIRHRLPGFLISQSRRCLHEPDGEEYAYALLGAVTKGSPSTGLWELLGRGRGR